MIPPRASLESRAVSTRVAIVLIALGWACAAVTIWMSATWVERLHRHDDCSYVSNMGPDPFWVCPAESDSPGGRGRSDGEGQA